MSADVPLFANTEDAEAYGRHLSLGELPMLVRTYFVTQRAIAAVPDNAIERKLIFALRSQHLREAIEAFLGISSNAGCGAWANPSTPATTTDQADTTAPVHASPAAEDGFLDYHGMVAPNDQIGAS